MSELNSEICPHCAAPMPGSIKFCPACGQPCSQTPVQPAEPARLVQPAQTPESQVHITCPQCQAEISADARFCRHCGHTLASPVNVAEVTEVANVAEAAEVVEAAEVEAADENETPAAGRGKSPLVIALVVGLLIVLAVAGYFLLQKTPKPEIAPVPESTQPASPAATEAVPEAVKTDEETVIGAEEEVGIPVSPAPEVASEPSPKPRPKVRSETPAKPVEPTPASAPTAKKTCNGLGGFSLMLCNTEGADRFWKCVPDGTNWNNDIPGCHRDAGNRNGRLY